MMLTSSVSQSVFRGSLVLGNVKDLKSKILHAQMSLGIPDGKKAGTVTLLKDFSEL